MISALSNQPMHWHKTNQPQSVCLCGVCVYVECVSMWSVCLFGVCVYVSVCLCEVCVYVKCVSMWSVCLCGVCVYVSVCWGYDFPSVTETPHAIRGKRSKFKNVT